MTEPMIPEAVIEALAAIREGGQTNMMARSAVARLASDLGYHGAAVWLGRATVADYLAALNAMGRRRLEESR